MTKGSKDRLYTKSGRSRDYQQADEGTRGVEFEGRWDASSRNQLKERGRVDRPSRPDSLFALLAGALVVARRRCGTAGAGRVAVGELLLVRRLQDLEGAHQRLVHRHHGTRVVELSAVVGRREERDQLPLGEELVPVFHDLRQRFRDCWGRLT